MNHVETKEKFEIPELLWNEFTLSTL